MLRASVLISGLAVAGAVPLGGQWFLPPAESPDLTQSALSHGEYPHNEHPLAAVLDEALQMQRDVNTRIRTFRCRLIKRERIDGNLQPQRVIRMYVREAADGTSESTFAARMDFLEPTELAGRKILFVDGANDDRMLVRKGGKRLSFVTLRLDPRGWKARDESLIPITEVGFHRVLSAIVNDLKQQMEADPDASNTQVTWHDRESIHGRECRKIGITHPERSDLLRFHRVVAFIDCQLGVPIHVEAYDWPAAGQEDAPLVAEYTFTDLALNEPLDAECFDSAALADE